MKDITDEIEKGMLMLQYRQSKNIRIVLNEKQFKAIKKALELEIFDLEKDNEFDIYLKYLY